MEHSLTQNQLSSIPQTVSVESESRVEVEERSISFRISSNKVAATLGLIAFSLAFVSVVTQTLNETTSDNNIFLHKLAKITSLDQELSIPTFFSAILLLCASGLLGLMAAVERKADKQMINYWLFLALGFLIMAFDELAAAHEKLIEPVRALLGESGLGVLYFAWVVPALLLVGGLSLFFGRFLFSLPSKTCIWFCLAATLFLGGAIGFELLEGRHVEVFGKENAYYMTLATIEEILEMAGVIVFIRALLDHFSKTTSSIRFSTETTK